jgi:quercetin dioxygenase-like cupin family protein
MTIDVRTIPIHLGPGGTARPIPDFDWTPERLEAYERETAGDGPDGRLVMMFHMDGSWTNWERHPAGDEVVIAGSGVHRFVQETAAGEQVVELRAGEALINPPGVWHTADTLEPGWVLTVTPGLGTEHRPR